MIVAVAAASALGFHFFGFIGVALVGLFIGMVAFRVDLEKDGATGDVHTPELYAQQVRARQRQTRSERAAELFQHRRSAPGLRLAKWMAAILIAVGLLGFILVQT